MGKRNRPSKGQNTSTQLDGDNQIPSFDERALSALTEKIEKGFGKNKPSQKPADSSDRGQKSAKPKKGPKSAEAKSIKPQETRGTKRDAQGNTKVPSNGSRSKDQKSGKGQDDRAALLQEILALGGTEEDLALVADAQSESENEDAAPLDKSLKKDLAQFVAGLGIEGYGAADEEGLEAEEETEEEWEEASNVGSTEATDDEVEPLSVEKAAAPKEVDNSFKDPNRLVSTPLAQTRFD